MRGGNRGVIPISSFLLWAGLGMHTLRPAGPTTAQPGIPDPEPLPARPHPAIWKRLAAEGLSVPSTSFDFSGLQPGLAG